MGSDRPSRAADGVAAGPQTTRAPELFELVRRLREIEDRILELTGGRVDAVLDGHGMGHLLPPPPGSLLATAATGRIVADILDALPANVAMLDQDGAIVAVNEGWRRFARERGQPATSPILGVNYLAVSDAADGEDAEYARAAATGIRAVLAGEVPEFALDYPCHGPDREGWYRLLATPVATPTGTGAAVMHIDITEQVVADRARAESVALYRALFEDNPQPTWVYDLATLRFLAVNDAAVARYGYTREEFLAMTIADIRPPEDVPRLRANLALAPAGRESAGIWRHRARDGSVFEVEISSSAITVGERPARIVLAIDVSERRRAEDELRAARDRLAEGQALLRMAMQVAQLGAWRVDLPGYELAWSDELRQILELPPDPAPSIADVLDAYVPEDRDLVRERFVACVEDGTSFDLELQARTAGGRPVWVRIIAEPVRDVAGHVVAVQGTLQDIDRRKQAEERERSLEDRLTTALSGMSDAFFLLDEAWRFRFVNDQAYRVLGRAPGSLLGANAWDEFPEAVTGELAGPYRAAIEAGEATTFEIPVAQGSRIVGVSAYPTSDGLAVFLRDVTERRRAEERLRESEERFRILAGVTSDAVWDWDLATDRLWWNEGFETLFGHRREDVEPTAASWTTRIHPDDAARVSASIHRVIDGDASDWTDEYRFRRADGTYATVVDRGRVVRGADGRAVRMVGGMTDVTAQRALEAQLRQAQRLEAVGQLTGGVAHDFNNLLTVIMGNTELLAESLGDQPDVRALADVTLLAAERGADLTRSLLAFSRRQPLEPRALDVNGLLAGMEGLLRRSLGEHVEVELARADGLWLADVDPSQLEAAILNLALNSRDAMPSGGRLTIETANVVLDADYAAREPEVAPGRFVLVAVSDTGAGISPDDLPRVFDPFFTTKPVGKGTGLGLSMVYGFAKQSGGHVKLYSERGQGTTVRLYLPRAGDVSPAAGDSDAHEPIGGDETVLLVEDDALVRRFAEEALSSLGYTVLVAADGPEALAILRAREDVDLLFTDIVMPGGMSGRQLAKAARRLRPGLRVLHTSGYTEDAMVHQGRLAPGVRLLSKPYRRAELARALRAAMERTP